LNQLDALYLTREVKMTYKYGIPLVRKCRKCKNLVTVENEKSTFLFCNECLKYLSYDNLRILYIDKWHSNLKIAKELNFSKTTIKRYLKKYNLVEEKRKINNENFIKINSIFNEFSRHDKCQVKRIKCFNCNKEIEVKKFASFRSLCHFLKKQLIQ
jgi:hypothetical protein